MMRRMGSYMLKHIEVNMKFVSPSGNIYHVHSVDRSLPPEVWVRAKCFETGKSFSLREKEILMGLIYGNISVANYEGCQHQFNEYIGFTDRYNYCTRCDEKEKA